MNETAIVLLVALIVTATILILSASILSSEINQKQEGYYDDTNGD